MNSKLIALALLSSLAMAACSSNSSSNNTNGNTPDNGYEKAANVKCQNPIAVDANGASDQIRYTHGRYALKSIQLYSVSSGGDSLAASAYQDQNFAVGIDCDGVSPSTKMNLSLNTGTVIDLDTYASNGESRTVEVSVEDGQIKQALSRLERSQSTSGGSLSDLPKGRFQAGDGYMTLNANMISATTLEIKLKLENSSGSGQLAEYGRFIFERTY